MFRIKRYFYIVLLAGTCVTYESASERASARAVSSSTTYGTVPLEDKLERARVLMENNNPEEARVVYEALLKEQHMPLKTKAIAQARLGQMYHHGLGGPKLIDNARKLYEDALRNGTLLPDITRAVAQVNLASLLQTDQDEKKDLAKVCGLYEAALDSGVLPTDDLKKFALHNLAVCTVKK